MLNALHSFYKPFCLTLLAVLGLACGHLVDTLLQMKLRPEITAVTGAEHSLSSSSEKTSNADLNLILQKNIFYTKDRFSTATMTDRFESNSGQEDSVPKTRSDLKLFGTVVADEGSQVLLKVDKDLQLYHLGEQIPGGGSVEAIRRNQVEIRNRDQSLTTLSLYEMAPAGSRGLRSAAEGNRNGTDSRNVTDSRNGTEGIRAVGENRWVISSRTIESVRENFADQLRLAQMQPRTLDGKTNGFLVQRINPRSLLAKLGLQRGDVVIDVNNIKLDSPEKALQIFQQLREARRISVAVERNGQPMSFAYEIE